MARKIFHKQRNALKNEQDKETNRALISGVEYKDSSIGASIIELKRMNVAGPGTAPPSALVQIAPAPVRPDIKIPGSSGIYLPAQQGTKKVKVAPSDSIASMYDSAFSGGGSSDEEPQYTYEDDSTFTTQELVGNDVRRSMGLKAAKALGVVVRDDMSIDFEALGRTLNNMYGVQGQENKASNIGKETAGYVLQSAAKIIAGRGAGGKVSKLTSDWTDVAKEEQKTLEPHMQKYLKKTGRKGTAPTAQKVLRGLIPIPGKKKEFAKGGISLVAQEPGGKQEVVTMPWKESIEHYRKDKSWIHHFVEGFQDFIQSSTIKNKNSLAPTINSMGGGAFEGWLRNYAAGVANNFDPNPPSIHLAKTASVAENAPLIFESGAKGLVASKDWRTQEYKYTKLGGREGAANTLRQILNMPDLVKSLQDNSGGFDTTKIGQRVSHMSGHGVENALGTAKELEKVGLNAWTADSPLDYMLRHTSKKGARGFVMDIADTTLKDKAIDPNSVVLSEIQVHDYLEKMFSKKMNYDNTTGTWSYTNKKGENRSLRIDPESHRLVTENNLPAFTEYTLRAPANNYLSGAQTSIYVAPKSIEGVSNMEQVIGQMAKGAILGTGPLGEREAYSEENYKSLVDMVKAAFGNTEILTNDYTFKHVSEVEKMWDISKKAVGKSGADAKDNFVFGMDPVLFAAGKGGDFDGDTAVLIGITDKLNDVTKQMYDKKGNFRGFGLNPLTDKSFFEYQDDVKAPWKDKEFQEGIKAQYGSSWSEIMGVKDFDEAQDNLSNGVWQYDAEHARKIRMLPGYESHEQDSPVPVVQATKEITDADRKAYAENPEKWKKDNPGVRTPDQVDKIRKATRTKYSKSNGEELPDNIQLELRNMIAKYRLAESTDKDALAAEAGEFLAKKFYGEVLRHDNKTGEYMSDFTEKELGEHLKQLGLASLEEADSKNVFKILHKIYGSHEFSELVNPFEYGNNAQGGKAILSAQEAHLGKTFSNPALLEIAQNWLFTGKSMNTGDAKDTRALEAHLRGQPFAPDMVFTAAGYSKKGWKDKNGNIHHYRTPKLAFTKEESAALRDAASLNLQAITGEYEQLLQTVLGADRNQAINNAAKIFAASVKSGQNVMAQAEQHDEEEDEGSADKFYKFKSKGLELSKLFGGAYAAAIDPSEDTEQVVNKADLYQIHLTQGILTPETLPIFEKTVKDYFKDYNYDETGDFGTRFDNLREYLIHKNEGQIKQIVDFGTRAAGLLGVENSPTSHYSLKEGGVSDELINRQAIEMKKAYANPQAGASPLVRYHEMINSLVNIQGKKSLIEAKKIAAKSITGTGDVGDDFDFNDITGTVTKSTKPAIVEIGIHSKRLSEHDRERFLKLKTAAEREKFRQTNIHASTGLDFDTRILGIYQRLGYLPAEDLTITNNTDKVERDAIEQAKKLILNFDIKIAEKFTRDKYLEDYIFKKKNPKRAPVALPPAVVK